MVAIVPPQHQQPLAHFCVSTACTRASIQTISKILEAAEPGPAKPRLLPQTRPAAAIVLMAWIGGDPLAPVAADLSTDAHRSAELCESARHV